MDNPDLYPAEMRERFAHVVQVLPVGTLLDFYGVKAVVTGHQMLPAHDGVTLPHMATVRDNTRGDFFVLHMNNADRPDTVYNGTVLPFDETLELAEGAVLRTPSEWETIDGVRVMDPDGWRGHNRLGDGLEYGPKEWDEPIVRDEWDHRMAMSTVDHHVPIPTVPTGALRESDDYAEVVLSVVDSGVDSVFFEVVTENTGSTGVAHYSRAVVDVRDPQDLIGFAERITLMARTLGKRRARTGG